MKYRGQFKSIVSKSHDLLKEEEEGEKEGVFNLYTFDILYFPIQVSHVQMLITSENILFFILYLCINFSKFILILMIFMDYFNKF